MALLNLTAFTPQMAFAACRAVAELEGRATLEETRRWLSPEPLAQESTEAGRGLDQALQFCVEFNLIRSKGKKLSSPCGAAGLNDFRETLRKTVLAEEHNAEIFESDKLKAHELTRALAWFLQLRSTAGPFRASDYEAQQQGGPRVIENDSRWTVFDRWAVFLGFAWRLDGGLVPDPTDAIRGAVDRFVGKRRLALPELVHRLGAEYPVLDGGSYRTAYLAARGQAWDGRTLSEPLSLALLRLEREGLIELFSVGDSEVRTLKLGADVDRDHGFVRSARDGAEE